jgi:hypothetical protein
MMSLALSQPTVANITHPELQQPYSLSEHGIEHNHALKRLNLRLVQLLSVNNTEELGNSIA